MPIFLRVVHQDLRDFAVEIREDKYRFFAVSSALETRDLKSLNILKSVGLLDPWDFLYALSLCFINERSCGDTQGLCLLGIVLMVRVARVIGNRVAQNLYQNFLCRENGRFLTYFWSLFPRYFLWGFFANATTVTFREIHVTR